MKVVEGEAIQVPEAESPCCILDDVLKVPNVSIDGNVSCFAPGVIMKLCNVIVVAF